VPINVDYVLLGTIDIPVAIGVFFVVKRAIGADDGLEHRYGEKRRRAHTSLMAQSLSQRLGELFVLIDGLIDRERYAEVLATDRDGAIDIASDVFQHKSANENMKVILELGGDNSIIESACDGMRQLRITQALCMIALVPSVGLLSFWISETGFALSTPLLVICVIALTASATVFLTIGCIELTIANRLSRQFEKHR
jgi:hypothetical protein